MVGAFRAECLQVAGERGWVAGDVDDLGGAGGEEGLDEGGGAADARGVGDDRRVVGGETLEQCGHPGFGGAHDEAAVALVAQFHVPLGGADGHAVDFDAGEAFHDAGAFEGAKKPTPQ